MSQHYSDPKREDETYALPDVETFEIGRHDWDGACPQCETSDHAPGSQNLIDEHRSDHCGWYYWFCFPGCLPDSEPMGPFETEAEALEDAREGVED